jgi:hypothetical protein
VRGAGSVEAFVFQCDPLIGLGGAPNRLIGLRPPYPYRASRNHWPLVHYDLANSNVYSGRPATGCHGADINQDGRVDVSDLLALAGRSSSTDPGRSSWTDPDALAGRYDEGDVNRDGRVGADDLLTLAKHWGQSGCAR